MPLGLLTRYVLGRLALSLLREGEPREITTRILMILGYLLLAARVLGQRELAPAT